MRAPRFGRGLALAVALAVGGLSGCFSLPDDDVTFACDPDDAPGCPDGYTCQPDGCCHRNGSKFKQNEGACRLGGGSGTGGTGTGTGG